MSNINDLTLTVEHLHDSPLVLEFDLPPEALDLKDVIYEFSDHVTGPMEFRLIGHDVQGIGQLRTTARSVCGRCLCPVNIEIDVPITAYWLHQTSAEERRDQPNGDSVMAEFFKGDILHYGPQLRELIMATLPLNPLCFPDCKGLCPTCGVNLNETTCACPPPDQHSPESDEWKEQLAKIRAKQSAS